jgi:hypothetical protein
MENENEELEIQHRQYIVEEDIEIDDLPNEIKQAMRNFNAKLKRYEDIDDEEEENELFFELQQDDVAIADAILSWWEDYNSEDDSEEEEEYELDDDNDDNDNDKNNDAVQKNTIIAIQQKVSALITDNKISVVDLSNAIGGEPDYPEQQVGNIRLRKTYLKPYYEVI